MRTQGDPGPTRCFWAAGSEADLVVAFFKNVAPVDVIRTPGAGASTPAGSVQKPDSASHSNGAKGAHVRSQVMAVSLLNTRCVALLAPAGSTPRHRPRAHVVPTVAGGSGCRPVQFRGWPTRVEFKNARTSAT